MTEALINHFAHLSPESRFLSPSFYLAQTLIFHPRRDVKVLVPGSGLGRLMYEVAKLGAHSSSTGPPTQSSIAFRFRLPGQRILALHASDIVLCLEQVRPAV
jgi:hypothetical protein